MDVSPCALVHENRITVTLTAGDVEKAVAVAVLEHLGLTGQPGVTLSFSTKPPSASLPPATAPSMPPSPYDYKTPAFRGLYVKVVQDLTQIPAMDPKCGN